MSNTIIKFPEIDYNYWEKKHPFYDNKRLEKGDTVSVGLLHAEKGGLIKKQDYRDAKTLIDTIKNFKNMRINTHLVSYCCFSNGFPRFYFNRSINRVN